MNVLYGGLITWLITMILVESELTRPLREMVTQPSLRYLVNCQLCSGVWISWLVALLIPGPFNFVLRGLLFKAVGHLILGAQRVMERIANG